MKSDKIYGELYCSTMIDCLDANNFNPDLVATGIAETWSNGYSVGLGTGFDWGMAVGAIGTLVCIAVELILDRKCKKSRHDHTTEKEQEQ